MIQSGLSTQTISLAFTVHNYSITSIGFYCITHICFCCCCYFSIYSRNIPHVIHIFAFLHQYASTRFTKDAFSVLLLLVSPPTLNHPERHKRCFIIGLRVIPMANAPNVENKLKAIMELQGCIADGATLR